MGETLLMLPPLEKLPNGVLIPTEQLILKIYDLIIQYRKDLGKNDPNTIRNTHPIRHLIDTLKDKPHKYKKDYKGVFIQSDNRCVTNEKK